MKFLILLVILAALHSGKKKYIFNCTKLLNFLVLNFKNNYKNVFKYFSKLAINQDLVVKADSSWPGGYEFQPWHWLNVSNTSFYIINKMEMKVTKWGRPNFFVYDSQTMRWEREHCGVLIKWYENRSRTV